MGADALMRRDAARRAKAHGPARTCARQVRAHSHHFSDIEAGVLALVHLVQQVVRRADRVHVGRHQKFIEDVGPEVSEGAHLVYDLRERRVAVPRRSAFSGRFRVAGSISRTVQRQPPAIETGCPSRPTYILVERFSRERHTRRDVTVWRAVKALDHPRMVENLIQLGSLLGLGTQHT